MDMVEYIAQMENRCREDVIYPRASQRAILERELSFLRKPAPPARRRIPSRWLGNLMLRVGERLAGAETWQRPSTS